MKVSRSATAKVLAVIVNWERPQDTIACIQSLIQSNVAGLSIIVVDNGSQDGSVAKITVACPTIDLLPLSQNTGFVGGYNAGIELALQTDATHILILNNDTIVDSAAVGNLLGALWDICVPKIFFCDDHTRIWAAGARWRLFPPMVVMRGYLKLDDGSYDVPCPLDYATGCALLVKRNVLETLSGFDPNFANYMEDYDFCYRARRAGFSIGYIPEARIYHKVSLTLGEGSPQKWWYLGRNTVLFYRQRNRFPRWMLWSYVGWVFLRETIRRNTAHLPDFWRGIQAGRQLLEIPP